MKHRKLGMIILACAVAAWLAPLCSRAQIAFVPNAGFESGTTAPDGWTIGVGDGGEGTWAWNTAQPHSGARSLMVRKTNAAGYSILDSSMVSVDPGKTYDVRAWIHVKGYARSFIYLMVTQFPVGVDTPRYPNAFGVQRSYDTGDGWTQLHVFVAIRDGNSRIRISGLMTRDSCDVSWDDFEVVPIEPGDAYHPRNEKPAPEVVPDETNARTTLAARMQSTAAVKKIDGRVRLVVDGKLIPPVFYVAPFLHPQDSQVADFRDAGVHTYLVPIMLGKGIYGDKGVWTGPDTYDFSAVESTLMRFLRVDPKGMLIVYLGTDPYRDWGRDHPGDVCRDQDGKMAVADLHPAAWGRDPGPGERYAPSLYSRALRADTAEAIQALVRHVRTLPAGKAVIGWQICGEADGEFFQWASSEAGNVHLADYSDAAVSAFRTWLGDRYHGDVGALQAAWRDPTVSFDSATIPSGARRLAAGFFLDPARDQPLVDYNRFCNEGIVDTVTGFASVVKREAGGPVVVGTYYPDAAGPADSQCHLALGRLIQSPDLDFVAAPAGYGVRAPGQPGECYSIWGSINLHGKLFVDEQDWRSWLSPPTSAASDRELGRVESAGAHNAIVRRASGMMLAFGDGTWWYDMDGGWFHDRGIMAGIAEAASAFRRDLQATGTSHADMAVFVDEDSLDYLATGVANQFRIDSILSQIVALNTSGTPYHLYLLSDLTRNDFPDYRAYVFLNAYHLSDAQRAALLSLRRDRKLLVFVHAPGVVGAADPASEIRSLTGIGVQGVPGDTLLCPIPLRSGNLLLTGVTAVMGASSARGPAYSVKDSDAMPLASYTTGQTAVAARDFGAWKSVFWRSCHG